MNTDIRVALRSIAPAPASAPALATDLARLSAAQGAQGAARGQQQLKAFIKLRLACSGRSECLRIL